jgi:glycosyltransferase involved in cell wall biosynthesis
VTTHVAICIATFRRPEGLERLIASLGRLTFADAAPQITIVVVDNDAAADPAAPPPRSRHRIVRHIEPARGLASVRNACLDHAPPSADFIAFVDDDEWVEPQWLDALLAMQRATGAEIVQGPVRPAYPIPPPNWMSEGGYHEVGPFDDGQRLQHGATGNVLIARDALSRAGARFASDYNASGGEDVDFFAFMLARGCRMVAAAEAVAHEAVPLDRMTRAWVLRRRYRTGHTLGLIARRQGGVFIRLAKALARIGYGIGQSGLGALASSSAANHGLANVAWGLGTLAGLLGLKAPQG